MRVTCCLASVCVLVPSCLWGLEKGSDLREERCLLVFLRPRSAFMPPGTVPLPPVLKDQFLKLQRVGLLFVFHRTAQASPRRG